MSFGDNNRDRGDVYRRKLLGALAGGTATGLAGCFGNDDEPPEDDTGDDSADEDDFADDTGTDDSDDHGSLEITDLTAEPQEFGTVLEVGLSGEADSDVEEAEITYGDQALSDTPEGTSINIEGKLTDIHEAETDDWPAPVTGILEDEEGETYQEEIIPHDGTPNLKLEPAYTEDGELTILVDAEDEEGLHWLELLLQGETLAEKKLIGTNDFEQEIELNDLPPGETSKISAEVGNTFGGQDRETLEAYIREFEPIEDQEIEIGAVYMPFFEHEEQWDDCAVGTPAVGTYYMDDEEALNRHGDLMRGHGISRLQFDFINTGHWEPFLETRENTILEEVSLECMWVPGNFIAFTDEEYSERFEKTLNVTRENFFEQNNYSTINGRPTVKIWDAAWLTWAGDENSKEAYDFVENEIGGFERFGDYVRERLEYNGKKPYLIGGLSDFGWLYAESGGDWIDDELMEMAEGFDALSNWSGPIEPGADISNEEFLDFQETSFEGYRSFTEENDQDFIPVVHPGFDDSENPCWGENRYTPRSTDHYQDVWSLANDFATRDRIDTTFNTWGEGHMIEPGTYDGDNFGTEYLEVVKDFAGG